MPQFQGIFRQPRQDIPQKLEEPQGINQGKRKKKRVTFRKKLMYIGDQPSDTFSKDITPSESPPNAKRSNSAFRRIVNEDRLDDSTLKLNDDIIKKLEMERRPRLKSRNGMQEEKSGQVNEDMPKLYRKVTQINIEYQSEDVTYNYTKQTIQRDKLPDDCDSNMIVVENDIKAIGNTDEIVEERKKKVAAIRSIRENTDPNEYQQSDGKSKRANVMSCQEFELSCVNYEECAEKKSVRKQLHNEILLKEVQLQQETVSNKKRDKKQISQPSPDREITRGNSQNGPKRDASHSLDALPSSVCSQTEDIKCNRRNFHTLKVNEVVAAQHKPKSGLNSLCTSPGSSYRRTKTTTPCGIRIPPSNCLLKTKQTQAAKRFVRPQTAMVQTETLWRNMKVTAKPATSEKCIQKQEVILMPPSDMKDKSTQMYEYLTESELYCVEWINRNLFEVFLNPYHLIPDERIKTASEMTNYTSEKQWCI